MQKISFRLLLITLLTLVVGCSSLTTKTVDKSAQIKDTAPIVFMDTGYSQQRNLPQLTPTQNQYAAEQMAKIVAYRGLAKQLYPVVLDNKLTVAEQVIKDESFRIYLDLFLREAKVVDSKILAGQQKVSLTLSLSSRFYQCFSSSVARVSQCLREDNKMQFTRIGYHQAVLSTVNMSCTRADCGQQLHVAGFSKQQTGLNNTLLNAGFYDAEWTVNTGLNALFNYFVITQLFFN